MQPRLIIFSPGLLMIFHLRSKNLVAQHIEVALVYKDISHMTTVFGTSLGPYLTSAYLSVSS